MGSEPDNTPLVAIVGQTASGKSALAMALAEAFNGEIICADSRTVYKGMDIGTAKPSARDRQLVRHHLIDITTPDKPLNAASFKQLALQAIGDVTARGKLPFLVGGTGLYVDAVLFDFPFRQQADQQMRSRLEKLSVEELHAELEAEGIPLPSNPKNPRHLIRQIETAGATVDRKELRPNTEVIGLDIDKEQLDIRIEQRVAVMFRAGLEQEVRGLVDTYGWTQALGTIGYQEFENYFGGEIGLAELQQLITRHTIQYAKRQKTWFKRNPYIKWICKPEEAVDLITTPLNKDISPF